MKTLDTLKFEDLKVGEFFIDFPTDGDNKNHGGYKVSYNIFKKIDEYRAIRYNINLLLHFKNIVEPNKHTSTFNKYMEIIKIK